jgi:cytoskeletal protein CcmA (bactofilin family)
VPGAEPTLIDGYTSVQAMRRMPSRTGAPRLRETAPTHLPGKDALPKRDDKPLDTAAMRIGHTIQPPRHDIVCYQCQYAFVQPGRLQDKALCPKCKTFLQTADHTIDSAWEQDLKTIGTINVGPQAAVRHATLVAGTLNVAGDVRDAELHGLHCVALHRGATFDLGRIRAGRLLVAQGADIALDQPMDCGNLEIAGILRAAVRAHGRVKILAGGALYGAIECQHLVVADGGGLVAQLAIGPEKRPQAEAHALPAQRRAA